MDYETVSAEEFGASLKGVGLNMLVRDVAAQVQFLTEVFGLKAHRVSADFAIMEHAGQMFQLHSDGTYHSNPLLGLLPESGPRGAGLEIQLYDIDPDAAFARATAAAARLRCHVLSEPADKPHGLREAYILCENGYAWVCSRVL